MAKKLKVTDLVEQFRLEVVAGEAGLKRPITTADLYRPGLELAGYFNYHPNERLQLMGKTELSFLETLSVDLRRGRIAELCSAADTPAICITRALDVPIELIEEANAHGLPLLRSQAPTTILASKITGFLERRIAPSTTIHGVLVDVYGVGMLITGSSGIGKSETALELVKRGHRLVADDAVEIRQTGDRTLTGLSLIHI